MIYWMKTTHGIEWGGGAVDTPRPNWVTANNAYWWCLCCKAQLASISSARAHTGSEHHWKQRRAMDQQWSSKRRRH